MPKKQAKSNRKQGGRTSHPPQPAQPLQPVPAEQPGWWRWLVVVNVVLLLAVALAMRVARLGNTPGVNGDEAWMGVQAMHLLRGDEFSWRTPTGNLLNLFFFHPELVLHAFAGPSLETLRWPAAASGMLAVAVNFFLCRAVFGRRTAWISTLLLAVLPVNIAYSRFAWDACQTVLATSCAIYPALYAVRAPERRSWWLIVASLGLVAALLVHPTNIFITPLIVVAVLFCSRAELLDFWRKQLAGRRGLVLTCLAVVFVAVGWTIAFWEPGSERAAKRIEIVRNNLSSLDSAAKFAKYFPRLFTGVTVYQYIAGSCMDANSVALLAPAAGTPVPATQSERPVDPLGCLLHDLAGVALFAVAAAAVVKRLQRAPDPLDQCLLAGWGLTLLGFFLVTQPEMGIMPHFERYAICLVLPTALVLSRGADWLLAGRSTRAWAIALLAVCWLWLASFGWYYFRFIAQTGGASHMAFRTAKVEPKVASYQRVLAQAAPDEPIWIASQEWWSWMPLDYLASANTRVHVVRIQDVSLPLEPDLAAALADGRLYCVEFPESPNFGMVRQWLADQAGGTGDIDEELVTDDFGRPILAILRCTTPNQSKPAGD